MIQHTFGLLVKPATQWRTVAALDESSLRNLLIYPCLLAILPAVAWYYGTTEIGWTVGDHGEVIRLTRESARQICILFYLTMLACIAVIGYFVHWMAATYGAQSSVTRGIVIIGLAAISWSVYLMYLGIPIVMNIPEERGFLFSSAVLAIAMVILICLMVGSVILWDFGAAPAFTD
jgi:hypothetical protein